MVPVTKMNDASNNIKIFLVHTKTLILLLGPAPGASTGHSFSASPKISSSIGGNTKAKDVEHNAPISEINAPTLRILSAMATGTRRGKLMNSVASSNITDTHRLPEP